MTAELITGPTTFSGVSIVRLAGLPALTALFSTPPNRNADLPSVENCLES